MINSVSAEMLGNTPQISLPVIMWHAVNGKSKMWLYSFAMALHALVDVPAALMQCGVINSIALTEVLVAICAVMVATTAVYEHKRNVKPTLQ